MSRMSASGGACNERGCREPGPGPVGDDFGASVFGVDSGAGTAVTDHRSSTPGGTGYLDADTESLRNVALATTGQSDRMTEAIEHGPTPFQQAMMEGLSRGY